MYFRASVGKHKAEVKKSVRGDLRAGKQAQR